ncbi:hypothetical protein G9A89_012959 [Geosiphon pyriformis]|nr:hypothetical protein G9A89_012959 [Geosiphon pyriformis]
MNSFITTPLTANSTKIPSSRFLRLPSKKLSAFLGVCTAFGGLLYRDRYLSTLGQERVEKKVAHIAKEPLGVHELPRKVTVYLAPPGGDGIHKTRVHFREYVKPVLVAAAIDYEIVEGTKPGLLRTKVRDTIMEQRQSQRNDQSASSSPSTEDIPITSFVDSSYLGHSTETKKDDNMGGVIVVGRVSYVEYLQGLSEGYSVSLDESMSGKNGENNAGNNISSSSAQKSLKNNDSPSADFPIPEKFLEPIVYVPFYNRIGWKNIPLRIFHAFNSYKNYDIASEETVKLALGNAREFSISDLEIGKDEERFFKDIPIEEPVLDEKIATRLKIYR